MKFAKKMQLVEINNESVGDTQQSQQLKKPSNTGYMEPKTLYDLDSEMHSIINSNSPDNEKWVLYNQALLRYLHFAAKIRSGHHEARATENMDQSFNNLLNNTHDTLNDISLPSVRDFFIKAREQSTTDEHNQTMHSVQSEKYIQPPMQINTIPEEISPIPSPHRRLRSGRKRRHATIITPISTVKSQKTLRKKQYPRVMLERWEALDDTT